MAEGNFKYLDIDVRAFESKTGVSRMRILQMLRNKTGPDKFSIAMGFYPENGVNFQLPNDTSEEYIKVLEKLYENKIV